MAVDLFGGSDWAAIAATKSAGERYTIKAGTHRMQTLPYRADDVIEIEPGAVITGAAASSPTVPVTEFAFDGSTHGWPGGVKFICTQDVPRSSWPIVERYKGTGNDGAFRLRPDNIGSHPQCRDHLVERMIVRHIDDGAGEGTGLKMPPFSTLRLFLVHGCLKYAFSSPGNNTIFEDGELHTCGFGGQPNHGGTKIAASNVQLRRVFGHDCFGVIFWFDVDAGAGGANIIEDCDLENPADLTIYHEVSKNLIIRRTKLTDSGQPGTGLSGTTVHSRSSGFLTMTECILYGCFKQFGFNQTDRGAGKECREILYEGNDVYVLDGADPLITGGFRKPGAPFDPFAPSANVKWVGNRYHVADTISPVFMWKLGTVENSLLTFAQWQAQGFDTAAQGGSLDTFAAGSPPPEPDSLITDPPPSSPPIVEPSDPPGSGPPAGPVAPPLVVRGGGRSLPPEVVEFMFRPHKKAQDLMYLGFVDRDVFLALGSQRVRFARPGIDTTEQIWEKVGGAIVPGPIVESPQFSEQGQDVQFVVIDPGFDFLGRILNSRLLMRTYQLWRVYFHDSGPDAGKIAASWMPCGGYLDGGFECREIVDEEGHEPGSILCRFRVTSPLNVIGDRKHSIQTNDRSHAKWFPDDVYMSQTKFVQHRRVFFGESSPDAPTGGKVD